MKHDAIANSIARRQHGLLSHRQIRSSGLPEDFGRRRVRQGRWERVHTGVYRIAGTPPTREQRLLSAVLAAHPGTVASHRSAGELWEFDGVDGGWTEISIATGHRLELRNVVVHRTLDLRSRHVTRRFEVPITNPMRTLVDLGLVVPRHIVQRAMDDALGRKLVSIPGLVRIWRDVARPGRNGSGVLRSLLEEHLPDPHGTRLEKAMLRLHRDYGLPEPEVQYEIRDEAGRFVGRVDYAHPADRVVVETDGYEKRTSLQAFRRDRVNDRKLHALGWTPLRFVWFEVMHTPREVADEIRPFLPNSSSALPGGQ